MIGEAEQWNIPLRQALLLYKLQKYSGVTKLNFCKLCEVIFFHFVVFSSSSPPVHFDTMTCGTKPVRRLSTVNSLREPTFMHTTEWLWYWEDELGSWNLYTSAVSSYIHFSWC